jgi:nicotinamidase-related amidase
VKTDYCIDTACRDANGLGYAITLVSDAHTTFDMLELRATRIIVPQNHAAAWRLRHPQESRSDFIRLN